jgi:tyrosine-protein kinase Etk/Wzc
MDSNQLIHDESINLRQIFKKSISHWPWFVLSIFIAVLFAFLYSKTSVNEYESYATILIKKDNDQSALRDFLFSQGTKPNVANEIGIINSIETKKNALNYLNTGVSFYHVSNFKTLDLYSNPPFKLLIDSIHLQPINCLFNIEKLDNNRINVKCESEGTLLYNISSGHKELRQEFLIDTVIKEGEWLITDCIAIKIDSVAGDVSDNLAFSLNSIGQQISFYQTLKVEVDKESSLVGLKIVSGDPLRSQELLNALIKAYLERDIQKKLEQRSEQISFIDQLIGEMSDSLSYYENQLAVFQKENLSIGIDAKSTDLYAKYSQLQSKLTRLSLQQRYYQYVEELLEKDKTLGDLISPTTLGIDEPIITDLVTQLIELYNQKSEVSFNTRKDNPYVGVINEKILNLKNSLITNIRSNLEALELAEDEHEKQLATLENKLSGLPLKSKQLNSYERKFGVIDELYTYLLKKRSEARIEKSATRPINEVIQWAGPLTTIEKGGNLIQIVLIAFILGILVPFSIIQLKSLYLNKLEDESQITKITDIPVLGQVLHLRNSSKDVFSDPLSVGAESFRSIRTNLRFFHNNNGSKVYLITSSRQGEGKSFVSHNLARAFEYNKQKTILLHFDLRKSADASTGLSTYLSNQCSLDEILVKHNDRFDEILSGPTPPNASELINSQKVGELINSLRDKYDSIIIDSPPLIPISDAIALGVYSDIQLFLARMNYTSIELLRKVFEKPSFRSFKKPLLLLNDIKAKNSYYGYYNKQNSRKKLSNS